jgi:hypothetical protein
MARAVEGHPLGQGGALIAAVDHVTGLPEHADDEGVEQGCGGAQAKGDGARPENPEPGSEGTMTVTPASGSPP